VPGKTVKMLSLPAPEMFAIFATFAKFAKFAKFTKFTIVPERRHPLPAPPSPLHPATKAPLPAAGPGTLNTFDPFANRWYPILGRPRVLRDTEKG
jgi:hypothetical protein